MNIGTALGLAPDVPYPRLCFTQALVPLARSSPFSWQSAVDDCITIPINAAEPR